VLFNYSNGRERGRCSGRDKPNFVETSGDVKPPKVEAKPNIGGASDVYFGVEIVTPIF